MKLSHNAGSWLLVVAVALVLCAGSVAARRERLAPRSMEGQLDYLQRYIEILEYLEVEEQLQGYTVTDTSTVEADVIIQTCDLTVIEGLEAASCEKFRDLVMKHLELWNKCLRLWTNKVTVANWNFETDMTEKNEKILSKANLDFSKWGKDLAKKAEIFKDHSKYSSLDDKLQRQIRLMAFATDPSDEKDMKKLIDAQTHLQQTYSKATVDAVTDKPNGKSHVAKLKLEPDLTKIMAESTDSGYLLGAWWGWRNATGPHMRDQYSTMVRLLNKGAEEHGFSDYAKAWIESQFDNTSKLEEMAETLWDEMLPLYQQLHAYVRTRLQYIYPEYNHIFRDGGIPAHLLGNMWAQNWENIYELVKPYRDVTEPDYGAALTQQSYSVDKMFKMAEQFYTSIGLFPMSSTFNQRSMKVRPKGKEVVCHASASDFFSKKPEQDFRIKMCTEIKMDSFETIHHEMGHIEYFMAYQDQPAIFRSGANSAFHEAIGDTISLSVMSSKHLQVIGLSGGSDVSNKEKLKTSLKRFLDLIKGVKRDYHRDINFLLKRALFKIAFLPFGYMIDKWRWNVFRGETTEENYNKHWWQLRLQYQGLVSPVERSEADFDAGAKYHIPSNSPYVCYFISFIVQFQFYQAMCEESGHTGPLFECDFYQSKEAGRKLLDMMELGKSAPWPEAMEKLTGSQKISTDAIKKYFKPLFTWLKKENARTNSQIGWKNAKVNWKS